jgi:hypothetical protein
VERKTESKQARNTEVCKKRGERKRKNAKYRRNRNAFGRKRGNSK